MQNDWILPFFDLCTNSVSRLRVPKGARTLWFEFNSTELVVAAGVKVSSAPWGVSIEVLGTDKVAGVSWGAAAVMLGELRSMAAFTGCIHNIPKQEGSSEEEEPKYSRTVTGLQGGKLCLKEGLISHLLTASYGNPSVGFSDVRGSVLPFIRNGGVKGLPITNETMGWHGYTADDTSNKLHITFLSTVPARPPPKAASRPRKTNADSLSSCSTASLPEDVYNQ
eukprot:TRINITY_DN702_c0_g3_i1.p1 TRINITY_DN702_c0_g3~~TRINITY_DN702_c0_g3_i1.p1  ORF type:complete len:240 (+),score=22.90 TRINITY_DN702_c0_g3_i1:53-721(+)